MKLELKKFDRMCKKLFLEQTTCTVNGKQMQVTDDGNGNIQITGEIESSNDQLASQQIIQPISAQYDNDMIEDLISNLSKELDDSIKASRAARTYSKYNNDDLQKIKYNQGFAEGKKYIIKMVLKSLTNAELTENESI